MKTYILKYILLIAVYFFQTSCTKDVDFSQINDLEISPVIESSLVFLDESANNFIDNGTEIQQVQDFIIIDFFDSEFTVENLIKADFVFETQNTINRGFELQIDFLNNVAELQHTFTVTEEASPDNNDTETIYTEIFEGAQLDALKNTSILIFTLRMLPGIPINTSTPGSITLKSKAILYFNIEA